MHSVYPYDRRGSYPGRPAFLGTYTSTYASLFYKNAAIYTKDIMKDGMLYLMRRSTLHRKCVKS